jgi:hypothetical protein
MAMPDSELRKVYSAENVQEAYLIKAELEDAGIEAFVVGEHLQNAIGELPVSNTAPQVEVRATDFDQARQIVLERQANRRKVSEHPSSEWTCPHCDEPNEPTFDLCWNCQTPRAGD